jgi:multidrug efflux pump subunit AcrA (membrane-fusion protein)
VKKGAPLFQIDDSVQKAVVAQQKAAAEAALALLNQLRAQPRKEVLEVNKAQVAAAASILKTAKDDLAIIKKSDAINPKSISRQQLIDATNAVNVAQSNLQVQQRNYELTKAGAWSYDIANQKQQYEAAQKTYESGVALLARYTVRAPVDGVVYSLTASKGSYASTSGIYETYVSPGKRHECTSEICAHCPVCHSQGRTLQSENRKGRRAGSFGSFQLQAARGCPPLPRHARRRLPQGEKISESPLPDGRRVAAVGVPSRSAAAFGGGGVVTIAE